MRSVYEYTNDVDDRLEIRDYIEDEVLLKITHNDGGKIAGVSFPDDEAPAVALAILEASGVNPSLTGHVSIAYSYLRNHVDAKAKEAEREAEDAKAKAYRDALFPGAVKWEHLDEEIRETHRNRYRAARKFFEES